MTTYLAFLRAINLGGRRRFPSLDILRVLREQGFADAATHAASGNLRFRSSGLPRPEIERILERAFAADRGFDVPTVVFSASEFADIAHDAVALAAGHPTIVRHYVYLLKDELAADVRTAVEGTSADAGCMIVRGRAAHALLGPGYRPGVVDPLGAARLLGAATNRNADVVRQLAATWC